VRLCLDVHHAAAERVQAQHITLSVR
jgi:hypothetical protein